MCVKLSETKHLILIRIYPILVIIYSREKWDGHIHCQLYVLTWACTSISLHWKIKLKHPLSAINVGILSNFAECSYQINVFITHTIILYFRRPISSPIRVLPRGWAGVWWLEHSTAILVLVVDRRKICHGWNKSSEWRGENSSNCHNRETETETRPSGSMAIPNFLNKKSTTQYLNNVEFYFWYISVY